MAVNPTKTQPIQSDLVVTLRYSSPLYGPNQSFSILRLTRENQSMLINTMLDAPMGNVLDYHLAYFLKVAAKVDSYAISSWSPLYFVRAYDRTFGDRPLFVFSLKQKDFGSFAEPEPGLEFVSKTFPPDKESILFPIVKYSIHWVLSHLLPTISENSLENSDKKVREGNLYFQGNFLPYFYDYLLSRHIHCEKKFSFFKIPISDLLPKAENPLPLEPSLSKRKSVAVKTEEVSKQPRNSH